TNQGGEWRIILCIFGAMNRSVGTKILFTFFFIIVACSGIKAVLFVPAPISATIKTETLSPQSGQIPDSELEGTHFHLPPGGHTAVQKNIVPSYLWPLSVFYNSRNAVESFQIKKSSRLIKDYLAHNYPSHNF